MVTFLFEDFNIIKNKYTVFLINLIQFSSVQIYLSLEGKNEVS